MARWNVCHQEVTTESCPTDTMAIERVIYTRDSTTSDEGGRGYDCHMKNGGGSIPHLPCAIEWYPKCGGQLMKCGHYQR